MEGRACKTSWGITSTRSLLFAPNTPNIIHGSLSYIIQGSTKAGVTPFGADKDVPMVQWTSLAKEEL